MTDEGWPPTLAFAATPLAYRCGGEIDEVANGQGQHLGAKEVWHDRLRCRADLYERAHHQP